MIIDTNLTIFGGTGDLTFRKLLPALYTMDITGKLSGNSRIVIIGRRDFDNARVPTQYEKDLAQYVNKPMIFKSCTFPDFSPRKGFKCGYYLTNNSKTVC